MENNLNIEIVERDPKSFAFHPSNPRDHSDESVARLAESIQEDPLYFRGRPILLSDRTGELVVIGGEGRTRAAILLGLDSVPSVVFHGLTEEDEVRIMQKDNSHTGKWDDAKLAEMAAKWGDVKMKNWAPDVKWKAKGRLVTEDDYNDNEKPAPKCKRGDIWKLGNHRLMCGDSTKREDVEKLTDGVVIDLCFTSPPYNSNHLDIPLFEERGGGIQKCTQKKYLTDNDNRTDEEYQNFLESNIRIMIDCCNEVFYNIGVGAGSKRSIIKLLNTFIESFKDFLYWEKTNPMPVIAKGVISSSTELIIAFGKNNSRGFLHFDNRLFHGVINGQSAASTNKYADIHKATFPVYLPATIIENFCPKNGTVIDCFCGTGTTIIAAEQLGRKCFGMELDPNYCDVIIDRWEEFTGKKAQRLNG